MYMHSISLSHTHTHTHTFINTPPVTKPGVFSTVKLRSVAVSV